MNWTYSNSFDLTNGGADDLTSLILASDLTAVTQIEVIISHGTTGSDNTPIIVQLGDSGGFEVTGYDSSGQSSTSNSVGVDEGFLTASIGGADANQEYSGVLRIWRWDESENLWMARGFLMEHGTTSPIRVAGYKTLSSDLTQVRLSTIAGTAVFTNGDAIVRYIYNG